MSSQPLPPKMTQQFAQRAKAGDYDHYVGCDIYQWFQGNNVVTLIGLISPSGYVEKISTNSMELKKREIRRKMD